MGRFQGKVTMKIRPNAGKLMAKLRIAVVRFDLIQYSQSAKRALVRSLAIQRRSLLGANERGRTFIRSDNNSALHSPP